MDDGVSCIYGLIVYLILLILNSFFQGSAFSVSGLNESEVKECELPEKIRLLILKYIDEPNALLDAVDIYNVLFNIYTGFLIILIIYKSIYTEKSLDIFRFILCGLLLFIIFQMINVVFSRLIPKKLSLLDEVKWCRKHIYSTHLLVLLLKPFILINTFLSNGILKIFKIDAEKLDDDVTEEDVISMVNEGHEQGSILKSEVEMIGNIFELDEKDAKDIMIHRKNIVSLDWTMSLKEAFEFIKNQPFSRYPVYEEDIDNIRGLVYFRDLALFIKKKNEYKQLKELKHLIREVSFIPETRGLDDLFKSMQKNKKHMVVVIDEYGQTSGIVTMEDILEEIVGNIFDEYDTVEENIKQTDENKYIMNALVPIEEVEEILNISMADKDNDFETLNGFLISKLDRIPDENEHTEVEFEGYTFTILSVENNAIKMVKVEKIDNLA
ncbi:putative hemolysin [Acetitomaculum ruminis DSM 5522]|uniref:Putative hemolysin n=1 Tax=Acetitomaculum ruminis DSM 5522 TaxID=1120918 RepID=A0A1I0V8B9_9FIRM|nr:hemolysin family protein [Acetitomaculum ruminis]SFA72303.1 putative hemolysin [Acetitomaculum ruminis DSM 5522]